VCTLQETKKKKGETKRVRKKALCFLAFCILTLAPMLLQACCKCAAAQGSYTWKVSIKQTNCYAQAEGWFCVDEEKQSEDFGYPELLVCYDSSASQIVDDFWVIPPNGVKYWIRFDWDKDDVWDEIIYGEYISFTGSYWSKSYSHSPETVTIEGNEMKAVGGIVVPVDKSGLLAPYIGLASTILVATVATAICVRRVKRRKEKQ
jgi:hypothetical protein